MPIAISFQDGRGFTIDIIEIMNDKKKILFICTGNIIRSPLAEHLFRHQAKEAAVSDQFEVDSAGTSSYHIGEQPDGRMRKTAADHGLEYSGSARQVKPRDLEDFDLIIAMDNANHRNLLAMTNSPDQESKIHFMREWDPQAAGDMDVPDPYYGGMDGFERTYRIVERSVQAFLEDLTTDRE